MTYKTILQLIAFTISLFCGHHLMAQHRDTLTLNGKRYVFSVSEGPERTDFGFRRILGIILLTEKGPVWKKVITLEEQSHDCNSMELELGSYQLVDSNELVVHTTWAYTDDALAGSCGYRTQRYRFLPEGGLALMGGEIAFFPAPQNQMVEGLTFFDTDQREAGSTSQEKKEQVLFLNRIERTFGAKVVFGEDRELLRQAVEKSLGDQVRSAQQKWDSLDPGRKDFHSCL
jgi:hypothetical protein